jgi:hypothetical protein
MDCVEEPNGQDYPLDVNTTFSERVFEPTPLRADFYQRIKITISQDGQSILEEEWRRPNPDGTQMYFKNVYQRIK